MSDAEEVKSKLNIVDVVADYVQLKKAGASYKARCPFHQERTPSFNVSPSRQIFHCFGCGKGGDVIEFVKEIEGVDFPAALKQLADRAGVTLQPRPRGEHFNIKGEEKRDKSVLYEINDLAAKFYHKVLVESPKAKEAREYLEKRNFLNKTLVAWQIGYAVEAWDSLVEFLRKRGYRDNDIFNSGVAGRNQQGKLYDRFRDRITFPIYENSWGKIVGFAARILHPKEGTGKYINTPETAIYSKSKVIYGLHQAKSAIRKDAAIIVVEGNVDVVKSHQVGMGNIVASSGTAFTENQRQALKRLSEKLVFAFDNDEAGRLAARRAMMPEIASGFQTYVAILPAGFKDADEVIDADPKLWQESIAKASDYVDFDRATRFAKLDRADSNIFDSAIREHLALVALVPNSVKAEEYCNKLARLTGNSMPAIISQHNELRSRIKNGMQNDNSSQRETRPPASPSVRTEQRFLGLLLFLEEQAYEFYKAHEPEHFLEPDFSRLFAALKIQLATTGSVSLNDLAGIDSRLVNRASAAAYAVESIPMEEVDPLRELFALSYRLRTNYLARRQELLARRIADLEINKGDITGLRQEFDELIKRKHQLLAELQSYGEKENRIG